MEEATLCSRRADKACQVPISIGDVPTACRRVIYVATPVDWST